MQPDPSGPWGKGAYLVYQGERKILEGFGATYRPLNPHDFKPDPLWSTEEERANHQAACDKYERAKNEELENQKSKGVGSNSDRAAQSRAMVSPR